MKMLLDPSAIWLTRPREMPSAIGGRPQPPCARHGPGLGRGQRENADARLRVSKRALDALRPEARAAADPASSTTAPGGSPSPAMWASLSLLTGCEGVANRPIFAKTNPTALWNQPHTKKTKPKRSQKPKSRLGEQSVSHLESVRAWKQARIGRGAKPRAKPKEAQQEFLTTNLPSHLESAACLKTFSGRGHQSQIFYSLSLWAPPRGEGGEQACEINRLGE